MGEYRTMKDIILDKDFCSVPDMGEFLDNDDIMKLANKIADGNDGGAYFLESPFSTELGYHEAENVFVVSGKPKSITDGDTVNLDYDTINDGSKPFVFADGNSYESVKKYLYQIKNLDKVADKMAVRILGINAPEVPHCRITYANADAEIVYAKFGDLTSETKNTVQIYKDEACTTKYSVENLSQFAFVHFKYTMDYSQENGEWIVDANYDGQREANDVITFLVATAQTDYEGVLEVYYEIVDENVRKNVKAANDITSLPKYAICFSHDPSTGREEDEYYNKAGTVSRNDLKDAVKAADEVVFILDSSTFKQQSDVVPLEYRGDTIRMSDDPAYAFKFFCNQLKGVEKTYTRLGYNYFGLEYNGRALGAMYLKINYQDKDDKGNVKKDYGTVWINAAKYLAFKYNKQAKDAGVNDVYQILPAYSSSPSVESNFNYNSGAFKMWSYNPDNQSYVDAFADFHSEKGGDDRAKIQKDLTGSDLDQLKEYTVLIGDTLLVVPPTSIRMVSQSASQRTSLIRSKGAVTKTIPKVERIIEMQLYFNGDTGINGIPYEQKTPSGETMIYYMNGLRSLIAQFKFTPYLPIDNKYINQVLNIEAVSLNSISINTVPGFPKTLQATIRLTDFEYRQFLPEILPPNIDKKEDFTMNLFAQTIHFPVMRYYYQKAIRNGEAANLLEYNTQPYLAATLGQKTVLQPMKFDKPLIDFYIANEEHLKMRKQLKEALEKKPFETVVTYTDTEKKFLKEVAKMHSVMASTLYKSMSKDNNLIQELNNAKGLNYKGDCKEVLDVPVASITRGIMGVNKGAIQIRDNYLQPIVNNLNTFFANKDAFDHTIIKDHNVVIRENELKEGDKTDIKVSLALKLVIDWNKASADLESKLKQDYGKLFAIDTKKLLVDHAFTIGYTAEFKKDATTSNLQISGGFSVQQTGSKSTDLDYSNTDISLLARLANDFGEIDATDGTSTNSLEGNDLFSQNQELAKMKDNIDLESEESMKFDKYPIYNCIVESVNVVYNNNFNKMSLNAMHGYVSQYIGASDTMMEVTIKTKDESIVNSLQTLPRQMAELLINYRKIMTCSPLRIDCEIARLAGINEVVVESVDVSTIPNMPGFYAINLRLMSVDRTLRNKEALKKVDNIDTSLTNNDSSLMTKNFFQLKSVLSKVELYPDLELPTLAELEKLGYYFIRYKNQKNREFPDADFYFVYLHAYTSEMLKESIISFFTSSDYTKLSNKISDDLTGNTKEITLHLDKTDDNKLITATDGISTDDTYSSKVDKIYKEAEAAFKGEMKYVDVKTKNAIETNDKSLIDKTKALLDLQESLSASNYATYDFNHQIKISVKDNTAFKEYNTKNADDIVEKVNSSLKTLIKDTLKKPISDENSIMQIVKYIAKDVLGCDKLATSKVVSSNKINSTDAANINKNAGKAADGSSNITNDLTDFIRNKLRLALSSAMTGKNSILDYDKGDQSSNIENWAGIGSILYTDAKGNKSTVPNVLKNVAGQDMSMHVLVEDDKDKYDGSVFGPFAIKKYDSKYLGSVIKAPNFAGKEGFLDPYYNKDIYNIFFAEEIADGTMDEMTEDREHEYIDIITDTKWDDKEVVKTMSKSTVAMYRLLLVWFYRLLEDESNSMLPNAFFYLKNVSETLDKYNEDNLDSQSPINKFFGWSGDVQYSSNNPMYLFTKGMSELSKVTSSIFGEDVKAQAEKNAELFDAKTKATRDIAQMKEDLAKGLLPAKLGLVCGLFTTLGALAVGEMSTPILGSVSSGNLGDYTDYLESIKSSYLDYDTLNPVDVKMRRFLSVLDADEYNNKNTWNKRVDSLKKYSLNSFYQRKFLEIADIPQIYLMHSFYDMVAHDMRGRMARAFPTYYMLLIDEGRDLGMWHLQDNFYDVSSISEFQVVKSRKIAADTASIMMTNLFGTFTSEDEDMKDEYQYTMRDAWNSIFSPRPYYAKEYNRRQNAREFNRAKMKPGARVHLRMGYEGDASRIPIVFNGTVAEVQTEDDMMNIICQGDGIELANPDMFNAADADDVADLKYTDSVFGGTYGMFNSETTPRDLLVNPLISSGTWIKSLIKDWSNSRFFNDNPFGIVHFGDKYYNKIFSNSGEVEQNIYEALSKPSWGYAGEANFNESMWATEEAPKIKVGLEGKKSYWDLMHIAASVSPEYISAVVPFQLRSSIFHGAPRYYCAYDYEKTAEGKVIEKRKPFQQYHIYTSYSDIIGNKIAASNKEIRTCAVGVYQSNGVLETANQSVGPMWLDIDIYPENQKMTTINCDFTHRSFNLPFTIPVISKTVELFKEDAYKVAWRATANGLKETVKDMYTGELIVMGDPAVKPHDKMFVYDLYNDIQGTFDIEAVVHTFSVETGFTTSISPDCVVAVDDKYEKIAHNSIKSAIVPALINTGIVVALSQKFANITRSMFFTAGQSIKSGAEYANNIVNGVKTVVGEEDIATYGGIAEKVLGKMAPAFGATATDFTVFSSISSLEKAFKALPTSHSLKDGSDLIKFLKDIKAHPENLAAIDPAKLKAQLEEALAETSKLNNIGHDAASIAKGALDEEGNITKSKLAIDKLKEAITNVDKLSAAYAEGVTSSKSMSVSYDLIAEIIKEIPADKYDEIADSVHYLAKFEKSGIVTGSANFEEAMTHLIKVADTTNDLTETSAILKEAKLVDGVIFGKTGKTLEGFTTLGKTLSEVNTIKKGAGAIKAAISSNLVFLAGQIVLTKFVEEYLERKLKNLQVLTVFPVMKNNLVMTAGLNGNKGSVFDSPTYNEPGFIEEMAINFFDGKYGSAYPLILECLINTDDMKEIVDGYRRDSSFNSGSAEVLEENYSSKLLKQTTMQDVSGIEAYKQMFLVPRVSNATGAEARVAFASNKLVDIVKPNDDSRIDQNLIYIFQSPYLAKFNSNSDPSRQVLLFSAQKKTNTEDGSGNAIDTFEFQVKSSTEGTGKDLTVIGKKIEQGGDELPVFDIPMLRKDGITLLERVVGEVIKTIQPDAESDNSTLDELHKHNIIIHNGTRVNEKKSWFCTGFSFTIQVKDYDNFGNILKELNKNQPKLMDDDGKGFKLWEYKKDTTMGDNAYILMVKPSK